MHFDEIGTWSEIKLDIVRQYAQAYSTILSSRGFWHAYVDGFAGSGVHISKSTGEFVPGSPLNALHISPPFDEYFLIDLDGDKVEQLGSLAAVRQRENVHVIQGDCNRVLLERVFPQVRYEQFRRALCLLDPYGLHLDWEVIETAGRMGSLEIFLNFPVMDMNRNVLWTHPQNVSQSDLLRMTGFWGNESWQDAAYDEQPTLFGGRDKIRREIDSVVRAFRQRLMQAAGFKEVTDPLPMRNRRGAIVYYLLFASQKSVALQIVRDIVRHYLKRSF